MIRSNESTHIGTNIYYAEFYEKKLWAFLKLLYSLTYRGNRLAKESVRIPLSPPLKALEPLLPLTLRK